MVFGFGSIVASKSFVPVGSPDGTPYLIIVGVPGSCRVRECIKINLPTTCLIIIAIITIIVMINCLFFVSNSKDIAGV